MNDLSKAQDPRELFDIVLANGQPTGRSKRRTDVHRDGDWHRAVHVWVAGIDEAGPFLTFQRRSMEKDTWPGKLDATVGGHFRAGESLEETLREVDEEIGITVAVSDLRFIGRRIAVNEAEPGTIDHEIQEVFLLRDERPLPEFRPSPAELSALVRVQLDDLLEFLAGTREFLSARSILPGESIEVVSLVNSEDFILHIDRYFYRVAIAARQFLNGDVHISI